MNGSLARTLSLVLLAATFSQEARAGEFSCNSLEGEMNRCALRDAHKMRVRLKLDRTASCRKGDSWGVDADGVWVDMGCQGVFTYKDADRRPWWRGFFVKSRSAQTGK